MQRLMLPGSSSLFLITLTLSTLGFAQSPAPSNETIRESDLRADLFFLASDAMRGRLSGTNQNRIAASFLATRFERLELAPMGPEQSYFHPFRLAKASLGTGNELELLSRRGAVVR